MAEPKQEWPELVGKSGEEAKEIIQNERPDLLIEVHGEIARLTRDYREDRVRIFTKDSDGTVLSAPRCG